MFSISQTKISLSYKERLKLVNETKPFIINGKETNRRVLEFSKDGNSYYHKNNLKEWNEELYEKLENVGITGNSILLNYYESGQTIGWHTDVNYNLLEGTKVFSLSLSLNNYTDLLGYMWFDNPKKKIELSNRTLISWCPFTHFNKNIKHRARTLSGKERLNITVRTIIK